MRGITFETMAHALMSTAYNRDGIASRSSGHLKASAPPSILLNRSEELLLSNQWIEINKDNTRVLTAAGRAEVTRRCQKLND
jgi:hypothetical protein